MVDVRDKILAVMATVFEMDEVNIPENAAPGLIDEWDSLRHMTLVMALEEEFSIRFTDSEMADFLNLEIIQNIISSKVVGDRL